ncbi:aminotransferase class V-fold PLP-dependent enzyme [Erythrobacter arachoides]|uniref:Cysteine desulfurase n=1 Tax=Aurantiacibacter arachoides TaxID=1850444 RepID=A0A845A1H3_9SPHN|nr:aminotransferase class V-fold PLP-dependent enzyme [Aurantiacibacter arachoides]MXO93564.1 aminotransferase class V-fold PLP-dependent enzyme [Aurantiacibacter arachoides]GGD48405.1 cysteine desulfurase [Aurantiacibacter arachoides]
MSRIYLDHAATSPLRPEARAAMEKGFAMWANPSSPHAEGRRARAALEDARERCKAALGWQGELIFTSGASEAARLAFDDAVVSTRALSGVEHDAIYGFVASRGAQELGLVDGCLALRADIASRSLVAVQQVNSETGTRQDIETIAKVVHGRYGSLFVDCAQSAGKLAVPAMADMVIVAAHKFGGPIGIGALLVRDFAMLKPAGGHERGYRRGTENLPGAMGMAAALEAGDWATSPEQRSAFVAGFGDSVLRMGQQVDYIVPLTHASMSAQALLIRLDALGFAVSAGSACSSGSLKPSRVLKAFGLDDDTARRTIRVSLGWNTTAAELDAFAQAWASL